MVGLGENIVAAAVLSAVNEIDTVQMSKRQEKGAKRVLRRFGRKVRCVPEGSLFAMLTITKVGNELHLGASVPSAHHSAVQNKLILSARQFENNDMAIAGVLEHLVLQKVENEERTYKFVANVFGRRLSGATGIRFADKK